MADTLSPEDLDAATRMAVVEAGNQGATGQQAVTAVAANRARLTGKTISQIVHAPGQFEGMTTPLASSLAASDPRYQAAAAAIMPVLTGQQPDPTNGATHFINPDLQTSLGRPIPSWAQGGDGTRIGAHVFFSRPQLLGSSAASSPTPTDAELDAAFQAQTGAAPAPGAPAAAAPASGAPDTAQPSDAELDAAFQAQAGPQATAGDGSVTMGPQGQTAPAAVQATYKRMYAAGQIHQDQPEGSSGNPYIQGPGFPAAPPGSATIDMEGNYTPAAPQPGLGQELIAGGVKALTGLPDALQAALGSGPQGTTAQQYRAALIASPQFIAKAKAMGMDVNAAADAAIQQQFGTQGTIDRGLGAVTGYNPENTPATTPTQQLEQAVGGGVTSALLPVGAEAKGASLLEGGLNVARNAITGAVGGASSQLAADAVPEPLKPAASFIGGIGGAVVAHSAPNALGAIANAPRPFLAALSDSTAPNAMASRGAALRLVAAADNPAALKASVAGGAQEIVPGSRPTTFQQSGDLGIGAAEKGMANITPEPFRRQAADQNAARVQALQGVQSGGDPAAVAQAVTKQFDDISAQHDAAIQTATQAAQAKASTLGGEATPEVYGADIRNAAVQADAAARAREGQLWDAIDPNNDLSGNVTATKQAVADIQGELRPTTLPPSAAEQHVYEAASQLPDVAPVRDLLELKKQVGALQGQELEANGRSPAYARLSRLYGAVSDNLSNSISDAVQSQQEAVASGQLAQDQTIAAKLGLRDWQQQRTQALAAGGGGSGAGGPRGGTSGVSSVGGAAQPVSRGPVNAPGDQGISGLPGQPVVDPELAGRIAAANTASRQRFQTFGVNPVDVILDKEGGGGFKVQNGGVAAKAFHSGPTGFDDTKALLNAAPQALPALQDYAAMSLRRAALKNDGTIDPNRFASWSKTHADSIRALPPETGARFADAASAGQAVGDAAVAKADAIRAYQQGATARLLKVGDAEDVTKTVGAVFSRPTSTTDMRSLVNTVASDPAAKQGLRQAVADHIANKLISNTEVGASGQNAIKGDQFQTFLKANDGALRQVFNPEEMGSLRNIADDLHRSARSANALKTAGSDTALNQNLGSRIVSTMKHHGAGLMTGLIAGVAGAHGAHGLGMEALEGIGSAIGVGLPVTVASAWRAAGVERINDVFRQAILNPDVAKALLAKLPAKATAGSKAVVDAKANLFRALARSTAVTVGANNGQAAPPRPKPPTIYLRNALATTGLSAP